MTFTAAFVWSLLRSLVIALAGLSIAVRLTSSLRAFSGRRATLWWGLVLLPVFVPGLLIGYGYRNFALSLVHHPGWNELLYAVLVTLQVVPVGVLVLVCSPAPPVSASALHVRRLAMRFPPSPPEGEGQFLKRSAEKQGEGAPLESADYTSHAAPPHPDFLDKRENLSLSLKGRGTSKAVGKLFLGEWLRHHLFACLPAGAVMFLLAFQESEVATLMQVDGWTEWLFTRYAGGLTMPAALRVLIAPVFVQIAVITTALWVVTTGTMTRGGETSIVATPGNGHRWTVVTFASLSLIALAGLPGAVVLRGTWQGFSVLSAHPSLLREIGIAVLFAVTAGGLAWLLSGQLVRSHGRLGRWTLGLAIVPGLMGALTLGMGVAGLVQRPSLVLLRDTPLPLLITEIAYLLPRAVLIRLLVGRLGDSSSVHAARLLASSEDRQRHQTSAGLLWRLDVAGRCGGLLLVCYWAYIELTLPSLLAPPGMTPAPVVLYNLMHYGQISGLSAMLFASMATPVVLMGVGWWGFRVIVQRLHSF